MTFKQKSRNYSLQILSPLHIGTGEKLNRKEYFVSSKKLYVIDLGKLLDSEAQDINNFCQFLEKEDSLKSLFKDRNADELCKYIIPCQYSPLEVSPHLKSIYNEPYVSGSSIKGAIRTSLLREMIFSEEHFPIIKEKLNRTLKKISDKNNYERKKTILHLGNDMGGEIERSLFSGEYGYNAFRALQISDTSPIENKALQISEVKVISLNLKGGVNYKKFSLYTETLKESKNFLSEDNSDTKLFGTLKIDNFLFENNVMQEKRLGYTGEKDIIKSFISLCQKFSIKRIDREIEFFHQCGLNEIVSWYKKLKEIKVRENQFLIQLGWGTGFDSKTITTFLPEEYLEDIRYYFKLGKKKFMVHIMCNSEVRPSYTGKGRYYCPSCREDNIGPEETVKIPFPKSRKIVFVDQKPFCPMGWALMTVDE